MTISVCLTVNDGLVLAADSATTLDLPGGDKQIYNHADKIFNLFKGLPVGAVTWGLGSIGNASMATVAKDFRQLITDSSSNDPSHVVAPWGICTNDYTIEEIAKKFRDFLDERLQPVHEEIDQENEKRRQQAKQDPDNAPEEIQLNDFCFRVAGYSAPSADGPEIYLIRYDGSTREVNAPSRQDSPIMWGGQGDAVERLVLGLDYRAIDAIKKELGYEEQAARELAQRMAPHTEQPLVSPAMPIIDAIALARFLVDTSCQYYRFLPGAPIIGAPIDVATITRHEGFKWIERKHFFDTTLNPDYKRKEDNH
jgi:hypothetical protein